MRKIPGNHWVRMALREKVMTMYIELANYVGMPPGNFLGLSLETQAAVLEEYESRRRRKGKKDAS